MKLMYASISPLSYISLLTSIDRSLKRLKLSASLIHELLLALFSSRPMLYSLTKKKIYSSNLEYFEIQITKKVPFNRNKRNKLIPSVPGIRTISSVYLINVTVDDNHAF